MMRHRRKKMRILAVDDDPIVQDLLSLALSRSIYDDLEFATSGAEALDLLNDTQEPFSCFLLDINMPEFDGVELCEKIRELPQYRETPIIMVTRLDHRLHLERAVIAGATDYVVKPFDGQEVVTRIELAECRRSIAERRRARTLPKDAEPLDDLPKPFQAYDLPVFS